jgi:hypothetical protein
MVYGLDSWGLIPSRGKIFLFSTVFRLVTEPTKPSIQRVSWVKWPGCDEDHSPPSSAEVKNGGSIPPFPHVFMA